MLNKNRENTNIVAEGKYLPSIREFLNMLTTFSLTVLAWVFFRAENIEYAWSYLGEIFSQSLFSVPNFPGMRLTFTTMFLIVVFSIVDWYGRKGQYAIADIGLIWKRPIRWTIYFCIVIVIFLFYGQQQQFIYFQF